MENGVLVLKGSAGIFSYKNTKVDPGCVQRKFSVAAEFTLTTGHEIYKSLHHQLLLDWMGSTAKDGSVAENVVGHWSIHSWQGLQH